ncbi:hypothetical protein NQ314_013507 [Rhamnusium bicolor]|uniref:Uncharacterized protein n=1 Tax=Rhamnusium bicolor TaxID=1586634 RepID=A0AAV8X679_9CUCU|nr:hypothetical protein NQ314_013507 [Rhamnusium bicolor]
MNKKGQFDNIITTLGKYETRIENFLLQPENRIINGEQSKFMAFQEPCVDIKEPKICIWEFLDKENLEKFLLIERKSDIRKHIDLKIGKADPKGTARTIFLELIYNFAPTSIKLFSQKETKQIMELFCKLYLRNPPLIRFLSLPNFAFCVKYELEPEPVIKKGKKDKKGKEIRKK